MMPRTFARKVAAMNQVTLLLTRYPLDEFVYEVATHENIDDIDNFSVEDRRRFYRTANNRPRTRISGQWGTMAMIIGPPITYASFTQPPDERLHEGGYTQAIEFVGRELWLTITGDQDIESMKLFTTVERYRTDSGALNQYNFGYVRMLSRDEPYGLQNESGNPVVRRYLKRGNGECIRVLGGATDQQRAILIHDTPHVGYVIGCIGPRPHNDRMPYRNVPNNPSDLAVQEIRAQLAQGKGKGTLYVLKN
jgi:hypothetical protein